MSAHDRSAVSAEHVGPVSSRDYRNELLRIMSAGLKTNRRWAAGALAALVITVAGEAVAPTAGVRAVFAAVGFLVFLVLWFHAGVRINAYHLAAPAEEAEIRTGALIHYSRAELHDLVDDDGVVYLDPARCRQRSQMWLARGLRASRRRATYVLRDGSAAAHVWGNLGPRPPATVLRLSGADLGAGPIYIRGRDGAIGLPDGYRGRQLT